MKIKGTLILTIVSLLERLSYYGVRSILVLYVIDPNVFNMDRTQTLEYYGYWLSGFVIASIPFSLITDMFLGQKKSVYIGGILSLLGYSLLIVQTKYALVVALILILMGTSLVKPSTTILIGRLFKKEDKNRTLAYMVFFMGINLGAFIGSAGIGYIGEVYAWKYCFIIAAISTMIYLVGIYLLSSQIIEIETNKLVIPEIKITLRRSILILPILICINIVFKKSFELETNEFILFLSNSNDQTFFGYTIVKSMLFSFDFIWAIPSTLLLFAFWYSQGVTNAFKSISISLSILIIAILATTLVSNLETNYLLEISMIPFAFYAFSEIVITPILTSYVTRISDVKYSNTIYSTFNIITYIIGLGFVYVLQNDFQTIGILAILSLTIIGQMIYKEQIRKLFYELK